VRDGFVDLGELVDVEAIDQLHVSWRGGCGIVGV
jgi:hypothetical protein